MSNETLELSEHELYFLPPGTPATAPATRVEVEVNGEMRVFLARLEWQYQDIEDSSFYFVFYRDRDIDAENSVILGKGFYITAEESFVSEQKKAARIQQCVAMRHFERFWCAPNAQFGIRFLLSGKVTVMWRESGGMYAEETFIGLHWEKAVLRSWSQYEFIEFCKQLYADQQSQLHFVLHWHNMLPEERDEIAFACENSNWENLRNLFSCALKLITYRSGFFPPSSKSSSY